MAKNLFAKYVWEVTTIYNAGAITLKGINGKWRDCYLFDGKDIPRKTFDNHRKEIETLFDVNIVCNKSDNTYSIEDSDGFQNGKIRRWLLENFAVNNMLSEAIEPQWLRDEIGVKVRKMAAMYSAEVGPNG